MINKSAGVRNVFSSVHIERGRGFRSAELIATTVYSDTINFFLFNTLITTVGMSSSLF